jgi:type I restriction enzyme S subunit
MSWPTRPVNELCLYALDCVNKTAPTVDYITPYKMIRTTNVGGGFIDTDNCRYVTEETFEKWTRRLMPKKGDVILSREAPIGEVGQIRNDDTIFLGQRLFHYRPNPDLLDADYLTYVLQSRQIQGRLMGMGFGATVHHIKWEMPRN